ncbi:amidohydrolase family protein [Marinibaculum pumilum]|uniref:Amidohydrolase family protein n=1 Tax=Marinibaculum pumilum TaxID=1766165 RepID=A0ABV7KUX3_9PROT
MALDLVLQGALPADGGAPQPVDIGIAGGRIAEIRPGLVAEGISADTQLIDLAADGGGCLVAPGFVETHIHLDKSCILDRCASRRGDLEEAIGEVAKAKAGFTAEDVHARASRTLEKCLLQGTTHMRTHLEVDPGIGLRGLEGVLPLVKAFAWALDLEICVFPQEGLLNNPGTDELMVEALKNGCRVVGAAPYTDSDPKGQIDRVFEMAREFDADIDMHLDFGATCDEVDITYVCDLAEKFGYGGRVAVGHVTKMSVMPPEMFAGIARRLSDAGVAVTVLPSTDLFLMGRGQDHSRMRGVTAAHLLLHEGVNCSLSTNNVLNPFTPFGDCSLVRMANLYANTCHVGARGDVEECFRMVTARSARLLRRDDYGLEVGMPADLVVLDAADMAGAVAELAPVLYSFKAGRMVLERPRPQLHRPA